MLQISDLAAVVYSAGKVFDGLSTGRLDTDEFLRTGDTANITSRSDLFLLEDLRDAAKYVVENPVAIVTAKYVMDLNATLSRSGSMWPGVLRKAEHNIGVSTKYGRHEPPALTQPELQQLICSAATVSDPKLAAINLFLQLAKAQPFSDGNKRTALFAANGYLLGHNAQCLLTIPVSDTDSSVAATFNDALARFYLHDEIAPVSALLANSFQSLELPSDQPDPILKPARPFSEYVHPGWASDRPSEEVIAEMPGDR